MRIVFSGKVYNQAKVLGRENRGNGESIVENIDGVFHLVADEILDIRQKRTVESDPLHGGGIQLGNPRLAAGSQIHFMGDDIGQMHDGRIQGILLGSGGEMMKLDRFD